MVSRKFLYKTIIAIAIILSPSFYIAGYYGHKEISSRVRTYSEADLREALEMLYDERTEYCDLRVFNILYQIDHQGYQFDLADGEVVLFPKKTKRTLTHEDE